MGLTQEQNHVPGLCHHLAESRRGAFNMSGIVYPDRVTLAQMHSQKGLVLQLFMNSVEWKR
jgi:hypothetical protein